MQEGVAEAALDTVAGPGVFAAERRVARVVTRGTQAAFASLERIDWAFRNTLAVVFVMFAPVAIARRQAVAVALAF